MKRFLVLTMLLFSVLFFFTACENKIITNFSLYIEIEGEGIIYPNKGSYPKGELIPFVIQAKDGWTFSHWTGKDSQQVVKNNNRYQVVIDKDIFLIGVFTSSSSEANKQLSVEIEGSGVISDYIQIH